MLGTLPCVCPSGRSGGAGRWGSPPGALLLGRRRATAGAHKDGCWLEARCRRHVCLPSGARHMVPLASDVDSTREKSHTYEQIGAARDLETRGGPPASSESASEPRVVQLRDKAPFGCDVTEKLTRAQAKLGYHKGQRDHVRGARGAGRKHGPLGCQPQHQLQTPGP